MTRVIYVLFFLFMLAWILQWNFTSRKVEEIKQSSEHIEKLLGEVSDEMDATLKAIRKRMDDEESWQQVKKRLQPSIEP